MAKEDSGQSANFSENNHNKYATISPILVDSGEFSIGDIVRYIKDALPRVFIGTVVFGLLALMWVFILHLYSPSVSIYRTSLVVTMAGGAPEKYPNGTEFALTDLRSPAVLDEVFQANKLSDYGISLAEFLGMVSVETYSPAYASMTERFRARLEDKALTFEERKSIEAEFKESLDSLNSKGILVSLSVSDATKLSDGLAQKIVDDIPAMWAKIFIDRLGVANLPVPVSGSELVDRKFISELDYPLAYDYLAGQAEKLQVQIASIESLPGAISFVSVKSGKGIADLQREIGAVRQFRLELALKPIVDQGLSKEPELTSVIYQNQINSLEKDALVQNEYSNKVSSIIGTSRSTNISNATGISASGQSSEPVNTQLDGGVFDKIIELSKRGEEVQFEQDLLVKKLDFDNSNISILDRKSRLIERRYAIINSTLTADKRALIERKFGLVLDRTISDLNRLWLDSFQFLDELNNKRLNYDKSLYRLNELSDNMRVEKQSFLTARTWLIAAIGAALGGLIGLLSFVWRRALKV